MGPLKIFLILLFFSPSLWALSFESLNLEPKSECDQNLDYSFYSICYSSEHRQALWTFHLLSRESIKGKQKRTNNFKEDSQAYPIVKKKDYKKSGYDRGHLVPAADMKLNYQAMSESFYMTNMSPQDPALNRGGWNALEQGFRRAVLKYGSAYIVTAPILNSNLGGLKTGVSIPNFFYKIAYFPKKAFMMAYLLPNQSLRGESYKNFAVSVDEIEQATGIDFFSALPDELESALESEAF